MKNLLSGLEAKLRQEIAKGHLLNGYELATYEAHGSASSDTS